MKYISLIVLLVLLTGSWKLFTTMAMEDSPAQEDLAPQVQYEIGKAVTGKFPGAHDINFQEIYSDILPSGEIKFHFSYSYIVPLEGGEVTQEQTSGEVTLTKVEETDELGNSTVKWKMNHFSTDNNVINFTEGTVISPDTK